MFIESVDENFILELKEDMQEYDGVELVDILKHLREDGPKTSSFWKESWTSLRRRPTSPSQLIRTLPSRSAAAYSWSTLSTQFKSTR